MEPESQKLETDTWFYAKRCFLALLEGVAKHMINLKVGMLASCCAVMHLSRLGSLPVTKLACGHFWQKVGMGQLIVKRCCNKCLPMTVDWYCQTCRLTHAWQNQHQSLSVPLTHTGSPAHEDMTLSNGKLTALWMAPWDHAASLPA